MEVDLGVVQKYSSIGISPPLYPDEMEEKIKEIEAKKSMFVERGAADEENAAENHKQRIGERLAELDARMKEDRAMQAEQAQRTNNRGGAGRGQRGGRGGYGQQSNRGNRGGRGGRGALQRQERERPERRMSEEEADAENQEFTGTEDVNEEESKPFKAAPKK